MGIIIDKEGNKLVVVGRTNVKINVNEVDDVIKNVILIDEKVRNLVFVIHNHVQDQVHNSNFKRISNRRRLISHKIKTDVNTMGFTVPYL